MIHSILVPRKDDPPLRHPSPDIPQHLSPDLPLYKIQIHHAPSAILLWPPPVHASAVTTPILTYSSKTNKTAISLTFYPGTPTPTYPATLRPHPNPPPPTSSSAARSSTPCPKPTKPTRRVHWDHGHLAVFVEWRGSGGAGGLRMQLLSQDR